MRLLWFEKGERTRRRRENTFFLAKRASVFTFARPRAALLVKKKPGGGGHNHNLSLPITKTTKGQSCWCISTWWFITSLNDLSSHR
jgi:hypothetical protein